MLLNVAAAAQGSAISNAASVRSNVDRGLSLAGQGHCDEAIPLLKQPPIDVGEAIKYKVEMAIARCAIRRRDGQATVSAIMVLKHDFPQDQEVLYLTTQIFLRIAETASSDLTRIAPRSYQVRRLQAESLESEHKWAEAAAIYRQILEENPALPGIHFQLGHAALSQPNLADSTEDAKREFQQELVIDPTNASAEFWLGEIAERDSQWEEAISRFTSAIKLDPSLWTAYLGLGMASSSAGRFADAIAPLERYVAAMPDDIAGHYQLATAYRRLGRKPEADRETVLQQRLNEKQDAAEAARVDVKK